jgi:hypothetical protein
MPRLTIGDAHESDLAPPTLVLMKQSTCKELGIIWMGTQYQNPTRTIRID